LTCIDTHVISSRAVIALAGEGH